MFSTSTMRERCLRSQCCSAFSNGNGDSNVGGNVSYRGINKGEDI